MSEQLIREVINENENVIIDFPLQRQMGKITILEALAEPSEEVSINMSHRSTQMGNGVDAEDD
ncbi:MAG: hypothetical protein NVSMB46_02010 [Candidatus Saccharimonadales bacterium]